MVKWRAGSGTGKTSRGPRQPDFQVIPGLEAISFVSRLMINQDQVFRNQNLDVSAGQIGEFLLEKFFQALRGSISGSENPFTTKGIQFRRLRGQGFRLPDDGDVWPMG